jgi:hypothetical protein
MKFTPDIFIKDMTEHSAYEAAELAQAAFDKWLSEQQVMFGKDDPAAAWWPANQFSDLTKMGRLVCIEELAPVKCEHPNDEICFSDVRGQWVCGKCNKTLQPNWSTE